MAFETFGDLRSLALTKAGEVATTQSKFWDKMLEYVQQSYLEIISGANKFEFDFGRPFDWAVETDPLHVVLKAPYENGQITFVNGSTAGTLSSPPSFSLEGWHIYLDGIDEVYRISQHGPGNTNFSFDSEYVGSSGSSNFKAVKLVYDLGSDVLRLLEPFRTYKRPSFGNGEYQIYALGGSRFSEDYPVRKIQGGMPSYFRTFNSKDDRLEVMFNGYVLSDTKIDADYVKMPSSMGITDKPLLPLKDREVIAFCAAAMLLFNEKNDSQKGSVMFNLAKTKLNSMLQEGHNDLSNSSRWYGRLISRPEQLNNPNKYLFRGF